MRDYKRFLVLSDTHVPYQDKKAVKLTLKIIKAYSPDLIVHIGDLMDFDGLSRFENKDPAKLGKLQDELDEAFELLRDWRDAAPKADFYYLKGNHTERLTRYIRNHAPELHAIGGLTIPKLLNLDELNIKYKVNGRLEYNGMLFIHGKSVRSKSGYTAMGEIEKRGLSVVMGHTHRLGHVYKGGERKMITGIECGCLCRFDMDYLEGDVPDWQLGLGYGYVTKDRNKRFEVHTLPIINYKVVLEGNEISL